MKKLFILTSFGFLMATALSCAAAPSALAAAAGALWAAGTPGAAWDHAGTAKTSPSAHAHVATIRVVLICTLGSFVFDMEEGNRMN